MSTECVKVIDFSSWQGRVDFAKVKASGVEAVYVRWGVGHINADAAYAYNHIEAFAQDLDFGAYQVLDFRRDPLWQADMYCAGLFDSELRPALDAERYQTASPRLNSERTWDWLQRVEDNLGVKPLIYSRGYWWDLHITDRYHDFSPYGFWVANYTTRAKPRMPRYTQEYALWQYKDKGTVDGINGAVDFNRFGADKRAIYRDG